MIIMLVGPIDYWWNENWGTFNHRVYQSWRDLVSRQLVEAGHLVYRPHEAFKGAWDERAQDVNRAALQRSDVVINLNPGVPAYGTAEELEFVHGLNAHGYKIQVLNAPPGDTSQIRHLITPLEDPYGDVHRKSYTKGEL